MTALGLLLKRFVIFPILLVLLAIGPWLHGLELPWEIFLFTALAVFLMGSLLVFIKTREELSNLKMPLSLLVVWFIYCCLFLIPLPANIVSLLSPNLEYTYLESIANSTQTLTISKRLTWLEVARVISVISVFVLCYLLAKSETYQKRILQTLFYSSAAMALYSQVNHFTNGAFEWVEAIPPWDADWNTTVRGTFSYKNQYAIYLAMTIAIGAGLVFDDLKKVHNKLGLHSVSSVIKHVLFSSSFINILLLLVMLLSLFGAGSRGGSLVFIVVSMLILLKHFFNIKNRDFSKKRMLIAVLMMAITTTLFLLSKSFERYEKSGLDDHGRSALHVTAVSVIKEFPLFGTGPGTYPAVQHMYKKSELGNTAMSKHAHSDYLEVIATHGGLGALLLASGLLLMLRKVFTISNRKNHGVVLGGQIAISCLLLHSLIDYNFGTLVLPIVFFVVLAVLMRIAESPDLKRY